MTDETWSVENKTVVITGANGGIGKATAHGLAERRARVVMVCRDAGSGGQAMAEIQRSVPDAELHLVTADLASLEAVRKAAEEILERFDGIHVLINNAATIPGRRLLSKDGYEMQFAVNHLAPFLLTNLLLSRLKECAPARIITVASNMHQGRNIAFDDLQREKSYSAMSVYGETKLANVLFTYELARRLADTGVTANCLHPGVVATGIARNLIFPINVLARAAGVFMLTPTNGARTSIFLAASPAVSGVTGKYFIKCKEHPSSPQSHDERAAAKLWELSAEMTGLPVA